MIEIKEKAWNPRIIQNATLITNGSGFMRTYDLNNGEILKIIKSKSELEDKEASYYDDFIDSLYKKLFYARDIDDKSILLPTCVYFDGEIKGYTMPRVNDKIELVTLLEKPNNVPGSLETKANILIALSEKIKKLNGEGIIFPDLANTSNTFFDRNSGEFTFIDYDGLQIQDASTYSFSSLLLNAFYNLLSDKKYLDVNSRLFTSNLDKYSLLLLFIYYTTDKCISDIIPRSPYFFLPCDSEMDNKRLFENFFSSIGISDTDVSSLIEDAYNYDVDNQYPDSAIKKLVKDYNLVSTGNGGYFRRKSRR